ncbi:MAG: HAMP domain-containing sensor histidine kinase [Campylobacterota bacterium]|nr:HAMP domain-containing sensor histidine kinase [Campylobacterota bacterium]
MLLNQLTLAYECLSAIGNSLELNSMMFEVMSSFLRKTGAISAKYYKNNFNEEPYISMGKKIKLTTSLEIDVKKKFIIFKQNDFEIIVLPLKYGCMVFFYKNHPNVQQLAAMLGNFQKKINLSISACLGVEKLEEREAESVQEIREKEKIILAQSKQAIMGEMIEMIAHQWRQPLTAIGMTASNITMDLLLDEIDTEVLKEDLHSINEQVEYLSTTIDDFRNFLQERKYKEKVNTNEFLEIVHSLIVTQIKSKGIALDIQSCADITISLRKNELIQVLLNILSNAQDILSELKREDKRITMGCHHSKSHITIFIEDNGGGIKDDVLPRIFEPYYSTKKKKNGTGLGLYMSKTIVEEHLNGKLTVDNTSEGAIFKIELPLQEENNEH